MNQLEWKWNVSESAWIRNLLELDVSLVVGGSAERPDDHLCQAVMGIAAKAETISQRIADYLDNSVVEVVGGEGITYVQHPERPQVELVQIEARDPDRSHEINLYIVTGYPDPYYLYKVSLNNGDIVKIVGGFW